MNWPAPMDQLAETSTDQLLEALAVWDELYQRGEDLPPASLGITDPALLDELRGRIEKQKRLYALLRLATPTADGAHTTSEALPTFPGYECIRKIGEGGMGIVYEARDQKLGRVVAIKTIADGRYATRGQLDRFLAEAEAVARLKHENVIAIYSIGEHEGRPYFVLEYADGGSLGQRVAVAPMTTRLAVELVERLACAVHAAHQAGIVHRDLKPSNILLTAEGAPKVSDFGLAKLLGSETERTLSGQVLGSPSYMAPEQAEGQAKHVGPLADVYALGAILYQALTGRPPFLGESQLETLKLVTSTEPVPPRQSRPDIPRDVEIICLKCLEKEPVRRYGSASALGDDLHRFLEGQPIVARPSTIWERSWRWCHRNPKLAVVSTALAATVLVAATTFVGMTYRHNLELRDEIGRTQTKAAEARRNYMEARSTIQGMLERLEDRRLSGLPRLLDLRRDLRIDALTFYDRILKQIDSRDPVVLGDTASALMEAATLDAQVGRLEDAKKQVRQALALIEGLRAKRPDDIELIDLHARCLRKLSGLLHRNAEGIVAGLDPSRDMVGRDRPAPTASTEAFAVGRQSIELANRLVGARPDDVAHQYLLAACHENYASNLGLDQADEAKSHYERAIEILADIHPARLPGVSQRLAATLVNLGKFFWDGKEYAQAEAQFRRAEEILISRANNLGKPPDNLNLGFGHLNVNWGGMLFLTGRPQEALARADQGLEYLEPYIRREPHDDGARALCLKLHGNRAYVLGGALGRHGDAAKEWKRVVELSVEPVSPRFQINWAIELVRSEEFAQTREQIELAKSSNNLAPGDRYDLACLICLYAAAIPKDASVPADKRGALVESQVRDALVQLKSAIAADPAMRENAKMDDDLEILRRRKEFQQLIQPAKTKP